MIGNQNMVDEKASCARPDSRGRLSPRKHGAEGGCPHASMAPRAAVPTPALRRLCPNGRLSNGPGGEPEAVADGGHDLGVHDINRTAGVHHEESVGFAAGDGVVGVVNALEEGAALALEAVFVSFGGVAGHSGAGAAA